MQIWLDTIDLDAIRDAEESGIIFGVTTNPTILSKAKNLKDTIQHLLMLQEGPVAVQVTSQDAASMIEEGRAIAAFSERMVVKIPVNHNGLKAMRELCEEQVPVLATSVFDASQAVLAANVGAAYVAPYFSHMENPKEVLKSIVGIYQENFFDTRIVVASLKNVEDLIYCAEIGVDAVTIKEDLYYKLIAGHPLINKSEEKFSSDWKKIFGSLSIKDLL